MKVPLLVLSVALSAISCQVSNNPPIPGMESGLTFGTDKSGIHIEAFFDLLCDGCAA